MERGRLSVVISLFASVVAIFLFSLKGKADWVYGVYLNATNETVTIDSEVSVFNSTANATGIFVENDTQNALNLTINTTVNATFYNETIPGVAAGVYFNGTLEDEQVRPLGNLTITSSGSINATAIGNGSFAGGVVFGNGTSETNVTNQGSISVFSNATEGNAEAVGIAGLRYSPDSLEIGVYNNTGSIHVVAVATQGNASASGVVNVIELEIDNLTDVSISSSVNSIVNSGNVTVTVRNNGGALGEALGFETSVIVDSNGTFKGNLTASLGNFTNTGNVTIYSNSQNTIATGLGVYVDYNGKGADSANATITASLDNFYNYGYFGVISNSTGGNATATGVRVGFIYGGGSLEGSVNATIGSFKNAGDFVVLAQGNNAKAYGVRVGIDNINNQDISSISMEAGIASFENTGNFSVSANATNGNATAYGIYASSLVNYINQKNFIVETNAYNGTALSYGVYVDQDLTNFINERNFVISANGTNAGALGVTATNMAMFINNGTYEVLITAQNDEERNFTAGVEVQTIGNFTNTGNYTVQHKSTNYASAYGIFATDNIENFTNNNFYSVTSIATNGTAQTHGILAYNDINSFNNFGSFIVTANAPNGNSSAYGVRPQDSINSFNNLGNFMVNASGDGSVYASGLEMGLSQFYEGKTGNFTNRGNFTVTAKGSNSTAYGINARTVMNFINANNFIVNATGSNVMAYGVNVSNVLEKFTNTGSMRIYATMSDSSGSIDAIGVRFNGTSDANNPTRFINNGTIEVKAYAPSGTNTNNINLAGIRVSGGHVEISNYGEIKLESSISGVKARTLYIEAGNVTLKDKFAITFGMPGINPDMRPIYVGSGATLNLNNATLIVRIESRNLRYNTHYYLIQNNGTVTGAWGELESRHTNPNILVRWGDPNELGENSSVIFEYSAGASPVNALASVIAGTVGTDTVVGSLITGFQYNSPMFRFMLTEDRDKPIMLASAGLSEVGLLNPRQKSYMYLIPVYTKVRASDLGFNADSYGFALGLGGRFSDRFGAEVFGGYVYNDVDFSVKAADSEKQKVFMGGINALYRIKPWFVRVSALGYTGKHDYRGYAGLNFELSEKADYNSRGYKVDLTGGYVLGGAKVRVIPQLGLRYSYTKVDSYWTKVEGNEHLNRRIKPDSLNVWKVVGGVDLDAEIERKSHWNMRFIGGVFIEEALGKNEVSAVIAVGSPHDEQKVKKNLADTTLSLNAGLSINYKRNWNFEVSGRGDFNGDYSAYTGRIMLRYNF
ncbi:MAG: autotransporter domain-containing protein [Desulfurococcaceae archaeon]